MVGWALCQVVDRSEQCRCGVGEVIDQHADFLGRVPLEYRLHAVPCGLQGRADLVAVGSRGYLDDDLAAVGGGPASADEAASLEPVDHAGGRPGREPGVLRELA